MSGMKRIMNWVRHPRAWSLLGFVWLALWRVFDVLLGGNFHAVDPGLCYRGAHPSTSTLARIVHEHHIRTVINMRGIQEGKPWYHEQIDSAAELGVKLVHIGMWSSSPPEVPEFRNLVRTLADDPGPFFLHCHTGSDRTGLGAALYLLLRTNATLDDARHQLGLYYGHIPHGRASCHDRLLDSYEAWLASTSQQHSSRQLRHWALDVYDGTIDLHRYNDPVTCRKKPCHKGSRCSLH